MIKCDKGIVYVNGSDSVLVTDFMCICGAMAEMLYKSTGSKDLVNKYFKMAVQDGIAEGFKRTEESEE